MTFRRAASLLTLSFLAACGSSVEPTAPTILSQPVDTSVAPGATTTFSVRADPGTAPVAYQWTWNGAVVEGATGPTYTTRPAEVADNGSKFTVNVSNGVGSVTSRVATLTVSPTPRAPRQGDMRFQGVGAAPFRQVGTGSNLACGSGGTFNGFTGTPVQMLVGGGSPGPSPCRGWAYATLKLPPSAPDFSVSYRSGWGSFSFETFFSTVFKIGSIVTSLDIVDHGDGTKSLAWSELTSGVFEGSWGVGAMAPANFLDEVAYRASTGYVITAVAPYGEGLLAAFYRWDPEWQTVYEASVRTASAATLADVASSLAFDGYIITAIGRDGAGGLILVGTRVQGDTMSRPLVVRTGSDAPTDLLSRGYAVVGLVYDTAASNWIWIAEQ